MSYSSGRRSARFLDFHDQIQVRNPDGEVAKLAALGYADEFVEERTAYYAQQDKRDRIEVKLAAATSATSRSTETAGQCHHRRRAGAVAGCGRRVLALTWMKADLLRTVSATERALGLPVLRRHPPQGQGERKRRPPAVSRAVSGAAGGVKTPDRTIS